MSVQSSRVNVGNGVEGDVTKNASDEVEVGSNDRKVEMEFGAESYENLGNVAREAESIILGSAPGKNRPDWDFVGIADFKIAVSLTTLS